MKEVFTMWRHTQLVVLVALSAAIYAAVLIPFKGFPIVPGYIELRPANAFPVVFGLLFGPAGAWGAAIGNLIGDFFGTLTLGSVGGFVGNFFLAYLPYKMWGAYFRSDENMETNVDSSKKLGVYILVTILASVVCALIISWWVALLGFIPFQAALPLITFNNAIMAGVLGPLLLLALYPRVKRWGLLWTEIMEPEEVSASRLQGNRQHPGLGGRHRRRGRRPDPLAHGRCSYGRGRGTRPDPVPDRYRGRRLDARRKGTD